jgi:hypothetical protein
MKIYLIFTLILSSVLFGHAQDCNYAKNETDEFEGKVIKLLEWQTIINQEIAEGYETIRFSLARSGDYLFLNLNCLFNLSKPTTFCMAPGSAKVILKLDNDSLVTADYTGDINCGKIDFMNSNVLTTISASYLIDKKDYQAIKGRQIKKMRCYFGDHHIDYSIPDTLVRGPYPTAGDREMNPQKYFIETLACIE